MKKDVVGKRMTLLVTGLGRGGAETQVVHLAKRLKARAWDVQVISMRSLQELAVDLEREGVPVVALNMSEGVADPSAIFRLTSLLRAHRPLVLHSHMVHANLLARAARPLARVPVLVCTAHNVNEGGQVARARLPDNRPPLRPHDQRWGGGRRALCAGGRGAEDQNSRAAQRY